ncbi:MAG: polysaccharide deacetylase family protein, partial [Bacteroidales bacterium]|nr:polysaccharide deacetylase family protein [Bacteroidales bacterium]
SEEQRKEIMQSKQELEALLGHPIRHFSYPHGAYNADTLSIINKQIFRSALLAWGENIRRGANPLMLPRIELRQPCILKSHCLHALIGLLDIGLPAAKKFYRVGRLLYITNVMR